ncbi:exosome complex RNA-binding protein Csl4 [Candidatus Bathyarchaeota archaeon]|nr:exosome complex RNA-binding protein Csl4 [Candidatus Bathyarchaeota archaeon]
MAAKGSGHKKSQIVSPGDRLGVIEEFTPDVGTYVKNGVIYSKIIGKSLFDLAQKRVTVYPTLRGIKVPKIGSTVIGQVSSVQTQNANIRIFNVDKKDLSGIFTAVLHVSDVQMRYVESMFDVCKPGDIIRARVISEKNRTYHLTTKDKDLGVIYAFCSNCGYLLEPRRYMMHCARCGRTEKRKTAFDYGKRPT